MSDPYLDAKVREAAAQASGSKRLAQKTLVSWALKDERLMLSLVRPYLPAIVAAAVDRAMKRGVVPPLQATAARPQTLSREALDSVVDQIGRAWAHTGPSSSQAGQPQTEPETLGSALAGDILGGRARTRPEAGPQHRTAIQAIAAAYKKSGR